nr:MAG TPA: hypothetical protein [Caudoviricetes sp.]
MLNSRYALCISYRNRNSSSLPPFSFNSQMFNLMIEV